MVYVHLAIDPMANLPTVEEISYLAETTPGWLKAVLVWDRTCNNYYEKEEYEYQWIQEVTKILESKTPSEYKEGCHILHNRASFMGEHICIAGGHLTTSLQVKHDECGQDNIVHLKNSKKGYFCIECQKELAWEDINKEYR